MHRLAALALVLAACSHAVEPTVNAQPATESVAEPEAPAPTGPCARCYDIPAGTCDRSFVCPIECDPVDHHVGPWCIASFFRDAGGQEVSYCCGPEPTE